jgi:8-oxo-dGTP pyrophosphatase MutT (NUDIX family)
MTAFDPDAIFRCDEGQPRAPNMRPKDAATLVLYRREGDIIRILMGKRHSRHAFLPGRLVFPGGRLEPADYRLAFPTDLRPEVRAKAAKGVSAAKARALALAALRETFEEAGILIGSPSDVTPNTRSLAWRRFFSHRVAPRLEGLDFIARAITPPGRPRRFDARFFMAASSDIACTLDQSQASGELLSPQWLTLDEARAADIIPITRCIIDEIEARLIAQEGPGRPVPFFIPHRGKGIIRHL